MSLNQCAGVVLNQTYACKDNNMYEWEHLYKRLFIDRGSQHEEPLWILRLPLDGSKYHLSPLLIIDTPEALVIVIVI